jgi:asparagine synthase (glutamine-hydrolysing)
MEFCNSLPSSYKLALLDEKSILKNVARGAIPEPIINRHKQPYRAPDATSFVAVDSPDYVAELLSEQCIKTSGIFNATAVQRLYQKCLAHRDQADLQGVLSNSDNMSFVGILSTQLLYDQFIANANSKASPEIEFDTFMDRTLELSR